MEKIVAEIKIDNLVVLLIAIYGAIISTFVLSWDIYKWKKSGPRIRGSVTPNMVFYNFPEYENKKITVVNITNTGDRPTTVTHLSLTFYKNKIKKAFNKKDNLISIDNQLIPHPIPYTLNSGLEWKGFIIQNDERKKMSEKGILVCNVYFSHAKKPINFVIKI